MGKYDESIQAFSKSYNILKTPDSLYYIGFIHYDLKNYEAAINFFNQFLIEKEKTGKLLSSILASHALIYRAFIYIYLGKLENANEDAKAISKFYDIDISIENENLQKSLVLTLENITKVVFIS